MRKWLLCSILLLSFFLVTTPSQAEGDMVSHPSCPLCGTDRHTYAQGRMLIRYDDGSSVGLCSIHCAAMELALNRHKTVKEFYAADYNGKRLIDARKAFWVIGGSVPGVMTNRAKWAFEERGEAEAFLFLKEKGGQISSFEEALKATFEDMYEILR
jgi:copper chaperone NosL